jgi:AbrB family looped-hinge helix DNA binding protein
MNDFNSPRLLGVARLNEKGQLVRPKEARDFLGIGPGDRVLISTAPFLKAIVVARPEDVEAQLQNMMSNTKKSITAVRKKLNDQPQNKP